MITDEMMNKIEAYYEYYRKTFINDDPKSDGYRKGIESICNHKEMVEIIENIPQFILTQGTYIDWVMEQMRSRVGISSSEPYSHA